MTTSIHEITRLKDEIADRKRNEITIYQQMPAGNLFDKTHEEETLPERNIVARERCGDSSRQTETAITG